ncbi:MAG TPA: cytochrome-c peroxidase, partial [Candidatus Limnocylindria bacterium]|nr:cytochrome-c peroxidase [Candidatus Limnocylindria bacterium]
RVTVVLVYMALVTSGVFCTAETGRAQPASRALPQEVRDPATNPSDPRKVELGRLLFWDPILSGRKDVACATCHHPAFGYAENLDLSIGVNGLGLGSTRRFAASNTIPFVKRNSQSILNVAFNGIDQSGRYDPANAPMFWDLRVSGLEAQALEPIESFEEMRGDAYGEAEALEAVTARLAGIAEYRTLFSRAFGGRQAVTAENVGKALAAFQRTLNANNSPFDRYMRGDLTAMTPDQVRGMEQFDRAGCANCHSGPMFSDFKPHVLGVPDNARLTGSDAGIAGSYAFRTPSLRNLRYTAPYMHSGTFQTLQDVLGFYRAGRRRPQNPNVRRDQLDPLLGQVNVGRGNFDIIAFLNALNDEGFDKRIPSRVPSGLTPGGNIQ